MVFGLLDALVEFLLDLLHTSDVLRRRLQVLVQLLSVLLHRRLVLFPLPLIRGTKTVVWLLFSGLLSVRISLLFK